MKDYYKIMGLNPACTEEDVKRVYRQLAKRYHPDLHPDDAEMAGRFADINEANAVLSDRQRRAQYDRQLAQARRAEQARTAQQHHTERVRAESPFSELYRETYNKSYQMAQQAQRQGYNLGYAQGFSDAQQKSANTEKSLKAMLDEAKERTLAAERSLREAQQAARKKAEELISVTAGLKGEEAARKLADRLSARLKETQAQLKRESELRQFAENKAMRLEIEVERLKKENDRLNAALSEWESYGRTEEENEQLRGIIEEWNEKVKEDRKWLKNTHYGALNLLYWVTEEQIEQAFAKLKKRYENKADEKSVEKLAAASVAYEILSDPKRRAEYDESIGVTQEEIEDCRSFEKEFTEAYGKLAASEEERERAALIEELTAEAEEGSGEAQNLLGEIYYGGEGGQPNFEEAFYWFKRAAESGEPEGKFNLGLSYLNGEGTAADEREGARLIDEAAKEGSENAKKFIENLKKR